MDCILLEFEVYLTMTEYFCRNCDLECGIREEFFMKKLRACVAGVGFIGAAHIEALHRLTNVEVVALADPIDWEKKAEQNGVERGYESFREMIEKEKPDVVHVCTPNNLHFEVAMCAMENGAAVVMEKPLTTTVEEAEKLVAYAKEHNIVNGVNLNCRFYPMIMQLKQMVKRGELGEIFTVNGAYQQDWLLLETDYSWRLEPELSGPSRAFADIGSHWIDMVESATGLKVTELLADFAIFHKTRKKPLKAIDTFSGMALRPEDYEEIPIRTEDYAEVLFHFDNGAHGSVTVSQVMAGRKNQIQVAVAGSKASLFWDSEDSNEMWMGKREGYNCKIVKDPSLLHPEAAQCSSYPGGHVEGFPDTFKQNFRQIYSAIAQHDTSAHDFARFEDGLHEMRLLEAVVKSAKERRWVKL